jgi:SCY1-like protein 2
MAHMLAAASSFFGRTNISQNYNIGSIPGLSINGLTSRPATPGGTSSLGTPAAFTPTFTIGLWKVQSAIHKVTNKRVSVWSFDKRAPDVERLGPQGKDRVMEVMKAEVYTLKHHFSYV